VIKKLDKLIIKAFVGPFVATFFITVLVLVMQFFWLYIDDFVGKGLSTGIILEFIWYQSAVLVPLALPLAVLLSSLMTFGNLGESYELIAIKSAGISLLRFMRPLFFVTLFICGVAFLFSNYIIPVANLKSRTLLADIVYAKPSFDLKEGVFYDKINGFSIKIGKKEKNDSVIRNIIIYEQSNGVQDNFIIATDGVMRVSENKRYMDFILKNGWRYEERGKPTGGGTDYIRLNFKEYKRQFDLGSFGLNKRTSDTVNKGNAKMLSMRQLEQAIDSLERVKANFATRIRSDVFNATVFRSYMDSSWQGRKLPDISRIDTAVNDSIRTILKNSINGKISSLKVNNEIALSQFEQQEYNLRQHQIEWHRKISLSAACLVLFLIGAPLGSIIRKGGLGSPLVFAIIFFMLFYFSSTTGEKFSKEGTLPPQIGMWLSTFFLVPIGLFLTYKAMKDSKIFNKDVYTRLIARFKSKRKGSSAV
jgi:lipopolysaccharide export system permease protein